MHDIRRISVVAAVIHDAGGKVLLTRRPPGCHMAGLWEFPGGKIRDGESPEAALVRELAEELGIKARVHAPITFAIHREPDLEILLLFFETSIVSGEPEPLEGQEVAWIERRHLYEYPTPPADRALVRHLAENSPHSGHHPGL